MALVQHLAQAQHVAYTLTVRHGRKQELSGRTQVMQIPLGDGWQGCEISGPSQLERIQRKIDESLVGLEGGASKTPPGTIQSGIGLRHWSKIWLKRNMSLTHSCCVMSKRKGSPANLS